LRNLGSTQRRPQAGTPDFRRCYSNSKSKRYLRWHRHRLLDVFPYTPAPPWFHLWFRTGITSPRRSCRPDGTIPGASPRHLS